MAENGRDESTNELKKAVQEPKAAAEQETESAQSEFFKRFVEDSQSLKEEKPIAAINKNFIVLGVVLIVIIAAAVTWIARGITPEEPGTVADEKRPEQLISYMKTDVKRVEITKADGTRLTFEADKDFNITCLERPDYPINQSTAGTLFYTMATVSADDTVQDDSSRKSEFGFDAPSAKAKITFNDGSSVSYTLGAKTPKGNTWYFMLEGRDEIFEVRSSIGTNMTTELASLRAIEQLPAIDYAGIDVIQITRPDIEIRLEAVPEGAKTVGLSVYYVTLPYKANAKTETVSTLIETLSAFTIQSFVETTADFAKYGLDDPQATLHMRDTAGVEITARIGGKRSSTEYYMSIDGYDNTVYTVSYIIAEAVINQKAFDLTDSLVGLVNIANLDAMAVEYTGKTVNVEISHEIQYNEDGTEKLLASGEPNYLDTFVVNGVSVENTPFKAAYTALIGISLDGEIPGHGAGSVEGLSEKCMLRAEYTIDGFDEPYVVEFYQYKTLYCGVRAGFPSESPEITFYVQKAKVDAAIKQFEIIAP